MKKHLLSFALLAGLVSTASADEFYVIKDGKLAEGVEVLEFDDPTKGPKVEETVAPDATPGVAVTHQAYCSEARFYVAGGIDLNRTWNVEIEFFYEEVDSAAHSGSNKWEVINLGLHTDTTGGRYNLAKVISDNTFNVKNKCKANTWNVERQFVYTPNNVKTVKEVIFGWQRQLKEEAIETAKPVYIKNLKFVGEGNKPFFYEDFEGFSAHSTPGNSAMNLYVIQGTDIVEYNNSLVLPANLEGADPRKSLTNWYVVQNMEAKYGKSQVKLSTDRLYEDDGSDGSEYYDTEVLHGVAMTIPENSDSKKASGVNGRAFTLIPTAGLEGTQTITADFIAKWQSSRGAAGEVFAESADSLVLPVKYAFVDDALEASTCDLTLVTQEPLASQWTAYNAEIPYNGAKKYLALVLDRADYLSYVVDNIRLTSDAYTCALAGGEDGIIPEYPALFPAYTSAQNVNAEESANADAIVSPVPATDVITVSNEGVESVEVVNTLGAVVASANGNEVNVANLAAGMYIVKATTANGVVTAKIIKK